MRLTCPHCGARDRREFTYHGAALARPEGQEWSPDWDAYIHLRDNPAGASREYWCHDTCGTFLIVTRDTVSHDVTDAVLPGEAGP